MMCTVPQGRKVSAAVSIFVWCLLVLVYTMEIFRKDRIPGRSGQAARLALIGLHQRQCSVL